jgi:hypothetical protein
MRSKQSENLLRTGSQAVSEQQRQLRIKEEFNAAIKIYDNERCGELVCEVSMLQAMLRGKFWDYPKEVLEKSAGGSMITRAKKLLLEPLKNGDAQHFIGLAKAITTLNQLYSKEPWELAIFWAFNLLLEHFEKTGGPFPDRDAVKKLAKHLKVLKKVCEDNNDDRFTRYAFTEIPEIPLEDRKLFIEANRTVPPPQWDRLFDAAV